jgi:hypothetical protein
MEIKIKTGCSGLEFSYGQGETVDAKSDIAKDLIEAGYAVEVKSDKTASKNIIKENPQEGADNATT